MTNNKEKILEILREELSSQVSKINVGNISETVAAIKSQLLILESISEATFSLAPTQEKKADPVEPTEVRTGSMKQEDDDRKAISNSDQDTTSKELLKPASESFTPITSQDKRYIRDRFSQKLKGGMLGEAFVPEKIIRELDLQDGDWVQASAHNKHQPFRYKFEILSKKTDPLSVRNVAKKVPVITRNDLNYLFISVPDNEYGLKVDVKLSTQDVASFRIKEGDLIDYSYYDKKISDGRVIWKHSDLKKTAGFTIRQLNNK